jgi:hypothetical protein
MVRKTPYDSTDIAALANSPTLWRRSERNAQNWVVQYGNSRATVYAAHINHENYLGWRVILNGERSSRFFGSIAAAKLHAAKWLMKTEGLLSGNWR